MSDLSVTCQCCWL